VDICCKAIQHVFVHSVIQPVQFLRECHVKTKMSTPSTLPARYATSYVTALTHLVLFEYVVAQEHTDYILYNGLCVIFIIGSLHLHYCFSLTVVHIRAKPTIAFLVIMNRCFYLQVHTTPCGGWLEYLHRSPCES
jgi:hypothetical protein